MSSPNKDIWPILRSALAILPDPVSRISRFKSLRNSEALWYRSSRSFSSALPMISSSLGRSSGLSCDAGAGVRLA